MENGDGIITVGRPAPAQATQSASEQKPEVEQQQQQTQAQTQAAAPAETKPADTPKTEEWKFSLPDFNKQFEGQFKDEEEVRSSLKNLSKVKDYENAIKELGEYKTKYEDIQSQLDPRAFFKDEDEFRRQQLLIKYPDYSREAIEKALAINDKSSDVDLLIAGEMLKGIDAESAQALIEDRFSLSGDPKDWDKLTLAKLKSEAVNVKKQVEELKNVKMPDKIDHEALRQQKIATEQAAKEKLKADATPFVSKIMETLKEVNLPKESADGKVENVLAFQVDEKFQKEFSPMLLDGFVNGTFSLDEAGLQAAMNYAAGTYTMLNLSKMISRYEKQLNTAFEEAKHQALHNDKPLDQTQAPAQEQKDESPLSRVIRKATEGGSSRGVKL